MDNKLDSNQIQSEVPKVEDLEPGQSVIAFHRQASVTPMWPVKDQYWSYRRVDDRIFRHLVEEVK